MNQNKCVRLYKVAMNKRRWEEAASKWVMNKVTQKFGKMLILLKQNRGLDMSQIRCV